MDLVCALCIPYPAPCFYVSISKMSCFSFGTGSTASPVSFIQSEMSPLLFSVMIFLLPSAMTQLSMSTLSCAPHILLCELYSSKRDMSCALRTNGSTCSAGFECLTEDLEEVLGLFSEVIQEPALQQDKVAFYKAQVCCHLLNPCSRHLNVHAALCQCTMFCSAVLFQIPLMTGPIMAACGRNTVSNHTQGVGHTAMQGAAQHVAS